MSRASWDKTMQVCAMMIVATICVVSVLLVTANSPGWDEIVRGIPAALIGLFSALATGRAMNK